MSLQLQNELTQDQKLFIEQRFFSTGAAPSLTDFEQFFNLSHSEAINLLPLINDYKQKNGLDAPLRDLLSPDQFKVAQSIMDPADRRSPRTKLKEAGVTVAQYNKWRSSPPFINYCRKIADHRFKNADTSADLELVKLIDDGDLKAITYYNEITGRHQTAEAINITRVLAMVMEVLVTYVSPDVLSQVAHSLDSRLSGIIDTGLVEAPDGDSQVRLRLGGPR